MPVTPEVITRAHIETVVSSLAWYASWKQNEPVLLFSRCLGPADQQRPSLRQVVEGYEALPETHPFRRSVDHETVMERYSQICSEHNEGRGYSSLQRFWEFAERRVPQKDHTRRTDDSW